MSRQTQSIFTTSTQSAGLASPSTISVESLGVTKEFSTLEIRATIKAKSGSGRENTLFTFHGGSVMRSSKTKGLFLSFMPRPFIYSKEGSKELLVNKETGELQHSSVKSFLVKASEKQIPDAIKPIIDMLKTMPPEHRAVSLELIKAQAPQLGLSEEAITEYLYQDGVALEHTEISPKKFLIGRLGHENVRFKANIAGKYESKIDSILEKICGGEDKYSIILRFDLTRVNAIKELVELQYYTEAGELAPRLHPITGDIISLQEVSIPLTYIGIEKGSTYDEDTSKYLNPELTLLAALEATKDKDNPVYMDESIIQARASKVNVWKESMAKFTGKKFLQNSGIIDRLYNELPELVANEVPGAKEEVLSIFQALEEDERVEADKLAKMREAHSKNVQEALKKVQEAANLPEPDDKTIPSTVTVEEEESQPTVEEEAVNLLSSSGFSLDALLGMNLAIDDE